MNLKFYQTFTSTFFLTFPTPWKLTAIKLVFCHLSKGTNMLWNQFTQRFLQKILAQHKEELSLEFENHGTMIMMMDHTHMHFTIMTSPKNFLRNLFCPINRYFWCLDEYTMVEFSEIILRQVGAGTKFI